jgi:Yip1 domain
VTMAAGSSNPIVDRAIRVARLDEAAYEEVARDPAATTQALMVVIGVAILGAVGALRGGVGPLLFALLVGPLAWVLSSALIYFVGSRLFNVQGVTWIEVARATGFAQVPSALNIFGIIPIVGALVGLVVLVWSLATGFFAVRTSMRLETGQAIITLVVAWVIAFVVVGTVLGVLLGVSMGAGTMMGR